MAGRLSRLSWLLGSSFMGLLSLLCFAVAPAAEAQYVQDWTWGKDANGNDIAKWSPTLNGNLERVWYFTSSIVYLNYNCAYMPAICQNARNFMASPRGAARRPYTNMFSYDFGGRGRSRSRRDHSCPSGWSVGHLCPEINGEDVMRQDGNWTWKELDPVQAPPNVIRHERDNQGQITRQSYLRFTCDEFPAATWVEGGTFHRPDPNNPLSLIRQVAETRCAGYRCAGTRGMKVYGEQNWQARAHTMLRTELTEAAKFNLGQKGWKKAVEPLVFFLHLDTSSGLNSHPAEVSVVQLNGVVNVRNSMPIVKRAAEIANMTLKEHMAFMGSMAGKLEDLEKAGYHLKRRRLYENETEPNFSAEGGWFSDSHGLANMASLFAAPDVQSRSRQTGMTDDVSGIESFTQISQSVVKKSNTAKATKRYTSLTKNATASQIAAARKMVDAAIVESGRRNEHRCANMARNHYRLKPGTIVGGSAVGGQQDVSAQATPPALLEVTPELAAAAALVAEADSFGISSNKSSPRTSARAAAAVGTYWMEGITRKGTVPWGKDTSYKVFRNVRDYGAVGDGKKDDTAAIKKAITEGNRCGKNCNGSTLKNAIIYFPPGTYLVTSPLALPFGTQIIGDATNWPTLLATSAFIGTSVLSTDEYSGGGKGPDGLDQEWFVNTANFYRQIRNLRIDITGTRAAQGVACIHYQVAQATSVQFVELIAKTGTKQRGIVAENGSGGVLADITFTGGSYGIWGGEQQFTAQRLTFNGCSTAVQVIWDWGWVWKSIKVNNANVGFRLLPEEGSTAGHIGSATFMDSTFTNVGTAVLIAPLNSAPGSGGTGVVIDNVVFNNVPKVVADTSGATLLTASGKVSSWISGPVYSPTGKREFYSGKAGPAYTREKSLLDSSGSYFERAKPQYENRPAGDFVHLKDLGAVGDGVTDDSDAVQGALQRAIGKILFIDAGTYILTRTVIVPSGSKIVGEAWSQFAASGPYFSNARTPRPMFQVGFPGQVGDVEMQDLIFTTKGQTPGVVLVQWNIKASSPGAAGIWDCHTRIGGATGTGLTPAECPASTSGVKLNCQAASLMMHVTKQASGYFENMWLWVADHIIDDPLMDDANNTMEMISVYVGRGMLVESQAATWLYGTSSEHSVYYQYNFHGAKNVFAGFLQTESPYYQPTPKPPQPFENALGAISGDPQYSCKGGDFDGCDSSWAVIIRGGQNIFVAGAGLYSWFSTYSQNCIDGHTCQKALVLLENNGAGVRLQNIITIGAKYSLVQDGKGVLATENLNVKSHPAWSQISIFDSTSNEIIWIDPEIWSSANPTVWCQPPCILKFPHWTKATQTYNFPIITATGPGWTTKITNPPITADDWLFELVTIDASGKQVVGSNAKRDLDLAPSVTRTYNAKRADATSLGSIWLTFAPTPVWPTVVFRGGDGSETSTRPASPTHPPPPPPAGPKPPPTPAKGGNWPAVVMLERGPPSPRVGICDYSDPTCNTGYYDGGYIGKAGYGWESFIIWDDGYEDPEEQDPVAEMISCPLPSSTITSTTQKVSPTPTVGLPDKPEPPHPSPNANEVDCFDQGAKADSDEIYHGIDSMCGEMIPRNQQPVVLAGGYYFQWSAAFQVHNNQAIKLDMSIKVKDGCEAILTSEDCHKYFQVPINSCNCDGVNGKQGGVVSNNCLTVMIDPNCQAGSVCI